MQTKEEILELVNDYNQKFPDEKQRSLPVIEFLRQFEGKELINRKNFIGHITTSAFITDETAGAILLLKHKSLNRWLQPGGHVDVTDDSLIASALREAWEETGLARQDLQLVSNSIFDIDSHNIPENTRKQEPGHIHHDIRFLFKCSNSHSLNISLEESTDSKWIPFSGLMYNEDFYWLEQKIQALK